MTTLDRRMTKIRQNRRRLNRIAEY
jgi:hypothetical protein